MTEEQPSGLRFDIYERVHLSEDLEGIDRLDEIELTPHIDVHADGEQTILKGHLRLQGGYTGITGESKRLDHRIPVEISMPSERIVNASNIGAEIEQFDFDLVSKRTLNVTGVLTLVGVAAAETRPSFAPDPQKRDEVLFVHEAGESHSSSTPSPPERTPASLQVEQNVAEKQQLDAPQKEANAEEQTVAKEEEDRDGQQEQADVEASIEAVETTDATEADRATTEEETSGTSAVQEVDLDHDADSLAEAELIEEVSSSGSDEMKISFSGSPPQTAETWTDSEDDAAADETDDETATSGVKWKNLFLSREEEPQFRKVRMCIVQKEETLETIAARYEMNPREILLYNRLGEQQHLTEGQVIYIPS